MLYSTIDVDPIDIWWPRLVNDPELFPYANYWESPWPIIHKFDGTENAFYSNFYPYVVRINGLDYATTEHFYQAMKPKEGARDKDGQLWSEKIRLAETPGKAKKLGRQCPVRDDWDKDPQFDWKLPYKHRVMKIALLAKFTLEGSNNPSSLGIKLLESGKQLLIEGNVWRDNYWGICIKKDCERGCGKIKGKNFLGRHLMELRSILQMREHEK